MKRGCINCNATNEQLEIYNFTSLTGKKFQAFFCRPCFKVNMTQLRKGSDSFKVNFDTSLGTLIDKNGNSIFGKEEG